MKAETETLTKAVKMESRYFKINKTGAEYNEDTDKKNAMKMQPGEYSAKVVKTRKQKECKFCGVMIVEGESSLSYAEKLTDKPDAESLLYWKACASCFTIQIKKDGI